MKVHLKHSSQYFHATNQENVKLTRQNTNARQPAVALLSRTCYISDEKARIDCNSIQKLVFIVCYLYILAEKGRLEINLAEKGDLK